MWLTEDMRRETDQRRRKRVVRGYLMSVPHFWHKTALRMPEWRRKVKGGINDWCHSQQKDWGTRSEGSRAMPSPALIKEREGMGEDDSTIILHWPLDLLLLIHPSSCDHTLIHPHTHTSIRSCTQLREPYTVFSHWCSHQRYPSRQLDSISQYIISILTCSYLHLERGWRGPWPAPSTSI